MLPAELTETQGVTAGFNIVELNPGQMLSERGSQEQQEQRWQRRCVRARDDRTAEEWGMSAEH